MDKLKKYFIYILLLVGFFILSNFLINVGLNSTYKKITRKEDNLSQVVIYQEEATFVNGRIKGIVSNTSTINVKYIKHKYNINMPNSTVINIVNTYEDRDEKLFKEMLAINAEYSQIDTNDVTMNDVEYLAGMVDTIYEYMLKSTGEFI